MVFDIFSRLFLCRIMRGVSLQKFSQHFILLYEERCASKKTHRNIGNLTCFTWCTIMPFREFIGRWKKCFI